MERYRIIGLIICCSILGFMVGVFYSAITTENPKIDFSCNGENLQPQNIIKKDINYFNFDGMSSIKLFLDEKIELSEVNNDTHSMNPSIPDGSIVITKPIGNTRLQIGDIVIIGKIAHRIINISNDKVLTKGDNNPFPDGWYNKTEIKKMVIGVIY